MSKVASRGRFEDSYKLVAELGDGANSVVHECRSYSSKSATSRFAVKISDLDSVDVEAIEEEFSIISKLDHENIIKGQELFISYDKVYTVMELVDGGELHNLINSEGPFEEEDALAIAVQLIRAVYYLHENQICHRDIKPENILVCSGGEIKLADFGLAVRLTESDGEMTECVGTQAYQAPEVLAGMPYCKEVDMWATGATIFTMMSGAIPFSSENSKEMQRVKILNGDYNFNDEIWRNTSKESKDFISKLLKVKPCDRITAATALQHPWLRFVDLEAFRSRWRAKSSDRRTRLRVQKRAISEKNSSTHRIIKGSNPVERRSRTHQIEEKEEDSKSTRSTPTYISTTSQYRPVSSIKTPASSRSSRPVAIPSLTSPPLRTGGSRSINSARDSDAVSRRAMFNNTRNTSSSGTYSASYGSAPSLSSRTSRREASPTTTSTNISRLASSPHRTGSFTRSTTSSTYSPSKRSK